MNKRLESTTEARPGVFGVPLSTSMLYANVEISLFDDDGQPYVYGYIPRVVASTGAFLKEKGKCGP
jgi:GTPase-activating protein SAC7